jgi:hypothetical protein
MGNSLSSDCLVCDCWERKKNEREVEFDSDLNDYLSDLAGPPKLADRSHNRGMASHTWNSGRGRLRFKY